MPRPESIRVGVYHVYSLLLLNRRAQACKGTKRAYPVYILYLAYSEKRFNQVLTKLDKYYLGFGRKTQAQRTLIQPLPRSALIRSP